MYLLSQQALPKLAIGLFGFLSFIQITFAPVVFYYFGLLFLVVVLSVFLFLLRAGVEAKIVEYLLFFLSCFFVGVFSCFVSVIIGGDKFDYGDLNIAGRLFNLFALFWAVIFISAYHKRTANNHADRFLVVRCYQLGVLVVLLIGVWQFVSFYSSIPFPFETRSHLHSTYGYSYSFTHRLTSVAREPSFFVMLAVDFVGLSLLFYSGFKRILMSLLGFIMIIFSLSPSGYIAFFGALGGAWLFSEAKYFTGRVSFNRLGLVFLILVFVLLFFAVNDEVYNYIYSRISQATLSNSGRFYMVVMPYFWSWDGDLFGFLFGHGMKSYSVIGTYYSLPNGAPVHPTSNNIYTDVFWESGVVGLVLLLLFFAFVFIRICRSKVGKFHSFVAFYFFFELTLSGMFRADFASARFFILLYLMYLLVSQPLMKREC